MKLTRGEIKEDLYEVTVILVNFSDGVIIL